MGIEPETSNWQASMLITPTLYRKLLLGELLGEGDHRGAPKPQRDLALVDTAVLVVITY